jgi:hypothetical protein
MCGVTVEVILLRTDSSESPITARKPYPCYRIFQNEFYFTPLYLYAFHAMNQAQTVHFLNTLNHELIN